MRAEFAASIRRAIVTSLRRRDVAFGEMSPEGRAQLAGAIRRGINAAREEAMGQARRKATDWSKCRSCQADVLWATTRTGKNMPVDAVPDMRPIEKGGGAFVLALRGGEYGVMHVEKFDAARHEVTRNRYTSHFSNCPAADQHRKGG